MVSAALGPDPSPFSLLPSHLSRSLSPHPGGEGRCFLKRPNQRPVVESGCYGDRHVPSPLALPQRRPPPLPGMCPCHCLPRKEPPQRVLRTTPLRGSSTLPTRQPKPRSQARGSHLLTLPPSGPVTSLPAPTEPVPAPCPEAPQAPPLFPTIVPKGFGARGCVPVGLCGRGTGRGWRVLALWGPAWRKGRRRRIQGPCH